LTTFLPAAAFAVALAAAGLTGCTSGTPSAAATCDPTPSGPNSDAVAKAVTGDFGTQASWAFTSPVTATTTERTVATAGDPSKGVVTDGKTADITYTLFNATTGDLIESSAQYSSDPLSFDYESGTSMPGIEKTLDCAAVGSRIVSVVIPDDAFGEEGYPDENLSGTDDIVMVIDVKSVADTPSATPTPVPSVDLPTPESWTDTTTAPTVDMSSEVPTITIPDADPSPLLEEKVLEEGDGAVVPNGSTVTVDYVGESWEDRTVFDSSYSRGEPASFATNEVITGFAAAVVGQKVGSTVLVSIPPDLAYANDTTNSTGLYGKTLVFLIQILDAQ